MGFLYFARQQVEMAVIEVGLGGRLDATNVVTPQVSVITSLSYDHTAWLGNTLAQIAFEKAGIIKVGVPAVSAPATARALQVVERVCAQTQSPLVLVGRDWLYAPGRIEHDGQWFARMRPEWYKSFNATTRVFLDSAAGPAPNRQCSRRAVCAGCAAQASI